MPPTVTDAWGGVGRAGRNTHPTARDVAEFVDAHRAGEPGDRRVVDSARHSEVGRLDRQTRLDLTRWAQRYISSLVANHDGGRDDVRAIVHDLHLANNVVPARDGRSD